MLIDYAPFNLIDHMIFYLFGLQKENLKAYKYFP